MMAAMDIGDNPPSLIQSALSGSPTLFRLCLCLAFQINSDLQAISRIEDSLQQISQTRQKHIEESRAVLRGIRPSIFTAYISLKS